LELSPDTQMLFYNIDKLKTEFIKKSKSKQDEISKSIHVLGFSIDKIPASTKLIFMLVIFALFALGIVFLLKKVATVDKKAKVSLNPDKKKK
jgi:hypothetical protein